MLLCIRHVKKKWRLRFKGKAIGFLLTTVMLSATSLICFAQVYKCIDANGRVTMGDQPCVVKSVSISTRGKEKEQLSVANKETIKEGIQTEKEQATLLRDALEQKILFRHNAECRDMRIQLKKQGHFATNPLLLEVTQSNSDKPIWERYRTGCLYQAKDIVVLDEAQKEGASLERARKAACDVKTRDYEKRKQIANSALSELESNVLASLHAEVKRGCR
jgi:hypothetical protein